MIDGKEDFWPNSEQSSIVKELSEADPVLPPEAYKVSLGEPLKDGTPLASRAVIISALKAVQDPELMFDLYSLGLIYEIDQKENGDVFILMTLTSPMCPVAGEMPMMVANAVSSVVGVGVVTVELTFEPAWTIERVSEEIRLLMGF
jgi:metal-sulfur cluster biosynthetic enzyme